jgi:LuxR family maltose regulon positive regulatory protein
VPRETLLARLDEGLERKLTLLSAPPGFGKTTLVSEWIGTQDERQDMPPVAWVSLDAGDNDPVRFWRYVITACQSFQSGVGESALPLLRQSQQIPFEALLTAFINDLAQLPNRYVLVLEDYHVIDSQQIHDTVAFLLDNLPPTLRLLIMTRSDPPLPLARLRARNDLSELRAADLRFSLAETQAFLQQALPFPLSVEAIARLEARTEGWVAGLRLVTLALYGRGEGQEIEMFLDSFSGSQRHILEYLVEEALGAQPEPLQTFLLQTSFLSRLTGSLCDALTGRADSASILEQLQRANLFLVPLDETRHWYRYHALFAEAMHHEAQRRLGEEGLCALYDKASRWYEQHGLLTEAVEAALLARTFDRVADLIERAIASQLTQTEKHTLRRWLSHLPKKVLHTRPTLCFTYAAAVLFTSDRRAPETHALVREPLDVAEQAWRAEGNRHKLGEVLAFRSLAAWLQWDLVRSFAIARQALELLSKDEVQWRGVSLIFVGVEELMAGKLNAAQQTLVEARALCETAENMYGMLDATLLLGEICARRGELQQAVQIYQQVLTDVEQAPMDRDRALLRKGRALAGLSALDLEWNALETAEQHASQALELGQQLADEELSMRASLDLARVLQARGSTLQAQQLLHALAAQIRWPQFLREVRVHQAWLALEAGDLAAVQHWHTTDAQPGGDIPLIHQEREALIVARMHIAQGEAGMALGLLERWQAEAHAEGRTRSELEFMVLTAQAHFSNNNLSQARQTLIQALTRAQSQGYQRLFLDEGEPMRLLIADCRSQIAKMPEGHLPHLLSYVDRLLAAFTQASEPHHPPSPRSGEGSALSPQPLIEPLSPREMDVLRLIAAGLSTAQIADELVITVGTVRNHLKNIYGKLDAHSRVQAVERARALNLL